MELQQIIEYNTASKGARFLNYIIDLIFVIILFFVIMMGIIFMFPEIIEDDFDNGSELISRLIWILFFGSVMFLQEWLLKGRTIGKLITGTLVVMEDGSEPEIGDLLKRNFSRLIPFEAFSFFGNRGWHDSISKTYVVNAKDFKEGAAKQEGIDKIGTNF